MCSNIVESAFFKLHKLVVPIQRVANVNENNGYYKSSFWYVLKVCSKKQPYKSVKNNSS